MTHPVIWSQHPFFYPIGNTPPVSFTETLAPEEDARVLCLGCGDPRSILYTVYSQHSNSTRNLDFTCCDVEPAIIARNVLLLTMAIEDLPIIHAWRTFYHLRLDDEALKTLSTHLKTLPHISDSMEAWNKSKFGKHLRFCTDHTLADVHRHWRQYLGVETLPPKEKEELEDSFRTEMERVEKDPRFQDGVELLRSAGPLVMETVDKEGTRKSFWATGVMNGKTNKTPSSPHINPNLAFSLAGRTFNVHYGTNPSEAFFLAPMYTQVKGRSTARYSPEGVVDHCIDQFTSWWRSFQRRLKDGKRNLVIRFFTGDCLAFAKALVVVRERRTLQPGIHVHAWGMTRIEFTSDYADVSTNKAPTKFNVIDTSNLTDHLGLLNILITSVPLLDDNPWASLCTNILVRRSTSEGSPTSQLAEKAFADIPTLSIFLGVAPTSHLSHFSTVSNKHEVLQSGISHSQLHENIVWKRLSATEMDGRYVLTCQETELSEFLFSVYLKMFSEEDVGDINDKVLQSARNLRRMIINYNRLSFVDFLQMVKSRLDATVDWDEIMASFFEKLGSEANTLSQSYPCREEFVCQLFLTGTYTAPSFQKQAFKLHETLNTSDVFQGWNDVPSVVYVVLNVPRRKLKVLEELAPTELLMPILRCMTTKGFQFQECERAYSLIRPTFGSMEVSGEGGESKVSITEDPSGWQGKSNLILTFEAPAWQFTREGGMTKVALGVLPNPQNVQILVSKLGRFDCVIHVCSIMDQEGVRIVRIPPGNSGKLLRPADEGGLSADSRLLEDRKTATVRFSSANKIDSLAVRDNLTGVAAENLRGGATPSVKPFSDTAFMVTFQGYKKLFVFPYPLLVNVTPKTRLARKSSYIEIEALIHANLQDTLSSLSLNLFPTVRTETTFNLLNVHYTNLDILPALQLPMHAQKLSWLRSHLGMMLSDAERLPQTRNVVMEDRGMIVNQQALQAALWLYAVGRQDL